MASVATMATELRGEAPPSEAGPLEAPDPTLPEPPELPKSKLRQTLAFVDRPIEFAEWARRTAGDVFRFRVVSRGEPFNSTCHPDHVRALFLAKGDEAPSTTGDSPLRPILGPSTVLTAIGPRHMRQRKLLLPSFHGEAVKAYAESIERAITAEIDRWRAGDTVALAPRMSAVTLEVIMAGIFGLQGEPEQDSPEWRLRRTLRRTLSVSTQRWYPLIERPSLNHDSAQFPLNLALAPTYNDLDRLIAARRAMPQAELGDDVMSLLMSATDDDGVPLTDHELRMELLTLVLAGHETTANSLAWTMERLVRNRQAYDRLRTVTRGSDKEAAERYVEATIHEGMRIRPVIPMIGRQVQSPWRLGDHQVPAGSIVTANIVLVHRREDVYPRPLDFLPERFLDAPPKTYEWIPFGGGIRRCLGSSLAMVEQQIVLRELARRVDMTYDRPEPERARLRNVTLIPSRGGRVRLARVTAG